MQENQRTEVVALLKDCEDKFTDMTTNFSIYIHNIKDSVELQKVRDSIHYLTSLCDLQLNCIHSDSVRSVNDILNHIISTNAKQNINTLPPTRGPNAAAIAAAVAAAAAATAADAATAATAAAVAAAATAADAAAAAANAEPDVFDAYVNMNN